MGLFTRAEKRIESVVTNVFARAFKGDVQPAEISARIQRELDVEAVVLGPGRHLAPNHFTVGLSPHDYEKLAPYAQSTTDEIVKRVTAHAQTRNYQFPGRIQVDYVAVESLNTGRFTVKATPVAEVRDAAGQSSLGGARLALEVNGVRHPLTRRTLVLGRGVESDLRINDPGVSRIHARITVSGPQTAPQLTIEDMDSMNGVTVNGQPVKHSALQAGSRITIGSTDLMVIALADL